VVIAVKRPPAFRSHWRFQSEFCNPARGNEKGVWKEKAAGGEIEQIQFLLGHASVLTTDRYLGCKQNLEEPVNDRFGCLWADKPVELR
jgi:hypothetical protein